MPVNRGVQVKTEPVLKVAVENLAIPQAELDTRKNLSAFLDL